MKEKLDKALCRDFPHVFANRNADVRESCFGFGFECNDGWEPIIRKAAAKLEPLIIQQIEKDPEGFKFGYYRTSQIKEKYGTLSWYLSGGTKEMYDIVEEVERESADICEACGKPGKLRGNFWLYTSCYKHVKPQDRDNLEMLENICTKNKKRKKKC